MRVFTSALSSPDGIWVAESMTAYPAEGADSWNYYTRLRVAKADRTVSWIVVDHWEEWGLGHTIPEPFKWSRDGRSLYFTNKPVPDGCGVFVNGSDLYKVNLGDGSITQVVPHVGLWLSLSPDENTLAYHGIRERGLVLRDLATGQERESKLDFGPDYAAGNIVWSPDSLALVLTIAIRPCAGPETESVQAESTSIVRVGASTLEATELINEDTRLFITLDWPTTDMVLLKDGEGDHWQMDVRTGEVTQR
jgi:hypothetical protein